MKILPGAERPVRFMLVCFPKDALWSHGFFTSLLLTHQTKHFPECWVLMIEDPELQYQKKQELQQGSLPPPHSSGSSISHSQSLFMHRETMGNSSFIWLLSVQQSTAPGMLMFTFDCSRLGSCYESMDKMFSQICFLAIFFLSPALIPPKPLQNTPFWLLAILVSDSFCRLKDFWAGWQT